MLFNFDSLSSVKNKLSALALGLGFVFFLGYFVSDLNPREEVERSLASSSFSFDKELSDLASKRVIQEMQSGRGVGVGSSPSELERFLFEDLKGEFSLEIEPEKSFRLSLLEGRESTVEVSNQFEFVKEVLGFLFDDQKNYRLVEKKREPASELASEFFILDGSNKTQAELTLKTTSKGALKSLLVKIPK